MGQLHEIAAVPVCGDSGTRRHPRYLWATHGLLDDRTITVGGAWGFTYAGNMVWNKAGGRYTAFTLIYQHELLLILPVVGPAGVPAARNRFLSVVTTPRLSRHSQKPPVFRDMIRRMWQLQRRALSCSPVNMSSGWEVWGNEAPAEPDLVAGLRNRGRQPRKGQIMKHWIIHTVEVVGYAAVVAGAASFAATVAAGAPADIGSGAWWTHTAMIAGTAAVMAARKALGHELVGSQAPRGEHQVPVTV